LLLFVFVLLEELSLLHPLVSSLAIACAPDLYLLLHTHAGASIQYSVLIINRSVGTASRKVVECVANKLQILLLAEVANTVIELLNGRSEVAYHSG